MEVSSTMEPTEMHKPNDVESTQNENAQNLGNYISNVQGAIGGAYQRMTDSLKSSVGMMEKMNSMMEDYVLKSVVFKGYQSLHCVNPNTGTITPEIIVKIKNCSQVPVENVEVSVQLFDLVAADSTNLFRERTSELHFSRKINEPITPSECKNIHFAANILNEMDIWEQASKHASDLECNESGSALSDKSNSLFMSVCVSLSSPGTGKTLSRSERFPLFFSNQCSISRIVETDSPALENLKISDWESYFLKDADAQKLRAYLQVSPFQGLNLNDRFMIQQPSNHEYCSNMCATLKVIEISEEDLSCTVEISAKNKQYLKTFGNEMTRVKRLKTS